MLAAGRSRISQMLHTMLKASGRLIIPDLCVACENSVDQRGLCNDCWPTLQLITDNSCRQCGYLFEHRSPLDRCGECLRDPPHFDDAIAAARYSGVMKDMVIALKHADRQDIAPVLANMMAPRMISVLKEADFILPLPLHQKRFLKRRFNQSAELARHVMRIGDIPIDKLNTRILIRHKSTAPQGHKTRSQRISSMRGAFQVPEDQREIIKSKHIVIIDDVLTTGASMSSAAQCLKRNGAKRVSACVAARVC